MDHEDFEFPPDSATEEFGLSLDSINNIPLRVLSNTPIEQLPPTIVPLEQQRPIRQVIRGSRQPRRLASSKKRANSSTGLSPEADEAKPPATAVESVKDAEPGPSPRNFFSWNKRVRFDWSEEELADFYKFLSQYGTDFNAIAVLFPGRSRADVKRLYHRELRNRREDVRMALESREEIDLATFRARLKKKEELQQGPTRNLDQEEEEALLQIEAGTLQLQPTQDGKSLTPSPVDAEFDFGEEGNEEAKKKKKRTKRARAEHSQLGEGVVAAGEEDVGGACRGSDEFTEDLVRLGDPLEDDLFGFF